MKEVDFCGLENMYRAKCAMVMFDEHGKRWVVYKDIYLFQVLL